MLKRFIKKLKKLPQNYSICAKIGDEIHDFNVEVDDEHKFIILRMDDCTFDFEED